MKENKTKTKQNQKKKHNLIFSLLEWTKKWRKKRRNDRKHCSMTKTWSHITKNIIRTYMKQEKRKKRNVEIFKFKSKCKLIIADIVSRHGNISTKWNFFFARSLPQFYIYTPWDWLNGTIEFWIFRSKSIIRKYECTLHIRNKLCAHFHRHRYISTHNQNWSGPLSGNLFFHILPFEEFDRGCVQFNYIPITSPSPCPCPFASFSFGISIFKRWIQIFI